MILQKIYSWLQQKNKIIYLVYSALALITLFPLLVKPGYVFVMDMVFTPQLRWPEPFNIHDSFLYLLNFILPSQVIQKILLFLILFGSGVSMHRLIPGKSELPKYFAGIFYVFNPFIYSRFLFGHLWLLVAYALMPFVVKAIFEFLDKINLKNTLKLSLWFVLIGLVSHHFIIFVVLFLIIASLAYSWKNRKILGQIFKIFKYTILAGLLFFILSSWWIMPYFNLSSSRGQFIQEIISQKDFKAFQTEPDAKYGILWNVAALYGFWGDGMDQYTLSKDVIPYWFPLFLIIFALVVWGAISVFRKDKFIVGIFIVTAVIAFILSVGIAYQPFTSIIDFLNEKIFIFKGFRDSQKFTALLVLTYAYLGALGFDNILKSSKLKAQSLKVLVSLFFISLPILYSSLMVWGFNGQLYTSHYPQEWFEVNEILNQDRENFKILFFPWHQYMPFSFAENKVFANPAPIFFDKETIAGDNVEVGEIYTQSKRPISQFIEDKILAKRDEINNLGEILALFNIKYIILAKEIDWLEYKFLDRQDDLEIIYDSDYLKVYQNKKWK